MEPLEIDGEHLTPEAVEEVAAGGRPVRLAAAARERLVRSRRSIEAMLRRGVAVYGVNTGFGRLADVAIPPEELRRLQINLLRSHAAGVGPPLAREEVRALLLLRANALARGYSGVRPELVEQILRLLEAGVHPRVPEQGSVGASGDLAPLAHAALVLIGEGEAELGGELLPGAEALRRAGLAPLELEAKEGLALINGTQLMEALGLLAWLGARRLADWADAVGALTFQALRGVAAAFRPEIQALRPHPGQVLAARRLRAYLRGSRLVSAPGELRVQDAYSLRCMPQVHGASRDALEYVGGVLRTELNAVTDNPLVLPETEEALSGGNFHGQPLALALDFLAVAVAELADIAERRTERLLNPQLSGLPAFLARNGGVESGLMLVQYTQAALVSENKTLAHPASVDSIPTSAAQEDHVSMGAWAARKARQVVRNTARVLAGEALAALRALAMLGDGGLSPASRAVLERLRTAAPPLAGDCPPAPALEALAERMLREPPPLPE
ncbi:MAG: histidine ammonia-lyase [Clostridia bacterium]|nr:histidine ammonia-lyase [Clostridia bacterium]MCL6522053.1 histidine ammonia-lyase [Bacillota bacterium]